jgi:hypothetical protein
VRIHVSREPRGEIRTVRRSELIVWKRLDQRSHEGRDGRGVEGDRRFQLANGTLREHTTQGLIGGLRPFGRCLERQIGMSVFGSVLAIPDRAQHLMRRTSASSRNRPLALPDPLQRCRVILAVGVPAIALV